MAAAEFLLNDLFQIRVSSDRYGVGLRLQPRPTFTPNRNVFALTISRAFGSVYHNESILILMFNYAVQKVRSKESLQELNTAIETLNELSRKTVISFDLITDLKAGDEPDIDS